MDEKNKNMIEVFERQQTLVDRLKVANMDEMVEIIEELTAMNNVVKSHISILKKFVDSLNLDKFYYEKAESKYVKNLGV